MHSISCPVMLMRSNLSCTHGEPVTKTSLPLKIPFTAKFCSSCKLLYPIQLAAFLITLSSSILLICTARQIIMMGGNLTHTIWQFRLWFCKNLGKIIAECCHELPDILFPFLQATPTKNVWLARLEQPQEHCLHADKGDKNIVIPYSG